MRLLRGSAANGYETVHSLSIPETSDFYCSSVVRTQNVHLFCTNWGFKNIYEVGLSRDGNKLELIKKHQTDAKNRFLTAATVGNIDYLFTSAEDKAVHLYRVDGSSQRSTSFNVRIHFVSCGSKNVPFCWSQNGTGLSRLILFGPSNSESI